MFGSDSNYLWGKRHGTDKDSQKSRSNAPILTIVIVLILAYASDFFFNSNLTVEMHTDHVVFRYSFMREPIYYDKITGLVLLSDDERFEPGKRISGISTLSYHAGKFQGGSLDGVYNIYLQKDWQGPVLIISHDDGVLVIGSATIETRQIYDQLQQKVEIK